MKKVINLIQVLIQRLLLRDFQRMELRLLNDLMAVCYQGLEYKKKDFTL